MVWKLRPGALNKLNNFQDNFSSDKFLVFERDVKTDFVCMESFEGGVATSRRLRKGFSFEISVVRRQSR